MAQNVHYIGNGKDGQIGLQRMNELIQECGRGWSLKWFKDIINFLMFSECAIWATSLLTKTPNGTPGSSSSSPPICHPMFAEKPLSSSLFWHLSNSVALGMSTAVFDVLLYAGVHLSFFSVLWLQRCG